MTYGPGVLEQRPYLVSSHVHVCCSNRHLVFLDVRNDQYLCLDQEKTATVGQFLRGWSGSAHNTPTYSNAVLAAGQEVLDALAARRLITQDASQGHDATPSAILNPTRSLLD